MGVTGCNLYDLFFKITPWMLQTLLQASFDTPLTVITPKQSANNFGKYT